MARMIWVGPNLMWDPSQRGLLVVDDRLRQVAAAPGFEVKGAPQVVRRASSVRLGNVSVARKVLSEKQRVELWTKVAEKSDAKTVSRTVRAYVKGKLKLDNPDSVLLGEVLI
jgi:hypothetical protein